MESYSEMIQRIRAAEAARRTRLSEETRDTGRCTLGKERMCGGSKCAGCGFNSHEAARRKRLPLWRDAKTKLFCKHVGRRIDEAVEI